MVELEITGGSPVAFHRWLKERGVSKVTGWRWRKSGMVKTVNINGRQYITAPAIAEFNTRAEAGDFSKVHPAPSSRSWCLSDPT